jgi:preprotein translocase subunit YajC
VGLLPLVVIVLLLVGMYSVSKRNRQRTAAAEQARIGQIAVGTEVMTTSGLYGTVVSLDTDGTVLLAIARGVEVKWSLAALRAADALPAAYRVGRLADDPDGPTDGDPRIASPEIIRGLAPHADEDPTDTK